MTNETFLEDRRLSVQPVEFVHLLFNDEFFCSGGLYATDVGFGMHGPFISINALHTRRADANVTTFRNFLIEMDGEENLHNQWRTATGVKLPFSTCTWSGGKSLHFIVSLETPIDEKTWRRWSKALVKAVPGADASTTNPSRFTRLPGAVRENGNTQHLLYLGSRIANSIVEEFVRPHLEPDVPNFRSLYNNMLGLTGLEAAHPLTKAFINGTHPCNTGRNTALFKCAADLKDVGLSIEEADELLAGPAEELGLHHREIVTTIKSAYRKERR